MLKIINSATGDVVGTFAMPYLPAKLDAARSVINREYGYGYSLVWASR